MLNYESRPGALPHTGARYKYDRKLNVVNDVLTGQVIKAKEDGTFDIGSKLYPNDLTEAELYLLTHKPLYLNQKDFFDNFRTPNGIITKFTSVVNFIKDSGLTRKQVYPRLRDKRQKKYGDIIFKYEDDNTDWIL